MRSFINIFLIIMALFFLNACQSESLDEADVARAVETALVAQPEPIVREVEVTRELEVTREVEVEVTRIVELVVTATPTETPIPTDTPTSAPTEEIRVFTALNVLDALKDAGVPIGEHIEYTAETDPNDLLGRPGQYLSKINFRITTLAVERPGEFDVDDGGAIEVFPDTVGAEGRANYIMALGQGFSPLAQYGFVHGPILLRLSSRFTPDQAQEYSDIVQDFLDN